jgi:hypothetical protein
MSFPLGRATESLWMAPRMKRKEGRLALFFLRRLKNFYLGMKPDAEDAPGAVAAEVP